jgi:L-ascorbate metabolism protein UlaG (beta-lactamase superfamily)
MDFLKKWLYNRSHFFYASAMKVTKYGHCCLLIEVDGIRVLTDPGMYSSAQDEIRDIDLVLITHEHPDHLHVDSLKRVIVNNPRAVIITNTEVGNLLAKEEIAYTIVEDGQSHQYQNVSFEGIGNVHAYIYEQFPVCQNTGYLIANYLFYPGDAFTDPKRPIEVLALPITGPWMKPAEAMEYAKLVKPKKIFTVHDGMLKDPGVLRQLPKMILEPLGIQCLEMEINHPMDV